MVEDMNLEVKTYQVGDVVKGRVAKVEEKHVLVDIEGSKHAGIIPISELSSLHVEKAGDILAVGDEVTAKVKKVEETGDDESLLILSKKAVDADQAWANLQAKLESGEVFEVVVKDVVKSGLVTDVGVRGFIPASLVETHFVEDFSDYKGRTLKVKVEELDRDKNRVILSHRAVLEQEQAAKEKETYQKLQAGQILEGTVRRITDFGVFVDIGDIDGLVHISQLSHSHVKHPSEIVQEGQVVKVKVLSVDPENKRISLSVKEALPGPWDGISQKISVGSIVEGKVKRLVPFGAFVEVLPGVEGLVHISQISNKHIGTPHEVLKEGEVVNVKVLEVNEKEHRVSLSMKELEEDVATEEEYNEYKQYTNEHSGFQIGEVIGEQLKKLK